MCLTYTKPYILGQPVNNIEMKKQGVLEYTFNPSPMEAEAVRPLGSRTA